MERLELKRFYTRGDPREPLPLRSGLPDLDHNRLGIFWRPIIDMADSEFAPRRLRMIVPVSAWLGEPSQARPSWFSMIGVPGLRRQVLRHAGLGHYDCEEPAGLPAELRTRRWATLVAAIDRFGDLADATRALVVFQLAQLSYSQFALRLAGDVTPDGNPDHDHYTYEVARIHARCPGHAPQALRTFKRLATCSGDPLLVLASCFQGIGHALRGGNGGNVARAFEQTARDVTRLPDDWHTWLVKSRFHRALAMLRLVEANTPEMRRELKAALHFNDLLSPGLTVESDKMVAAENMRYILELQIRAAIRDGHGDLRTLCTELNAIDPYCVEARLIIGDGLAASGDYPEAALWYSRAGELGAISGAVGWFRAAQCYDFIGNRGRALNAMGRCLELDAAAVEARVYVGSTCNAT